MGSPRTIISDEEEEEEEEEHEDGDADGVEIAPSSFGTMMMMMQSSSSSLTSSAILPGMMMTSSCFNTSRKDGHGGGACDLGDHLDQALFLFLDDNQEDRAQKENPETGRPPTLNIFPSQPMHHQHSTVAPTGFIDSSPYTIEPSTAAVAASSSSCPKQQIVIVESGERRRGSSRNHGPKATDPKALRRLAQNREAARKSRLRRKTYIQQLEASRMRLTQLEQELHRARSQGLYVGGAALSGGDRLLPPPMPSINSSSAAFDMEFGRWQEEHQRMAAELRSAVADGRVPENELRILVESCLRHYDQVMNLKSMMAKSDAFHLLSGVWKAPAERCFMWIGGFRPSHLIKIIVGEVEALTEAQVMGICELQGSTREAEGALTQGLEALKLSLSQAIVADSLLLPLDSDSYMSQMAAAIPKLYALQDFLTQADNLRLQTLHRMHQMLTTRQETQSLLAMAEYFHRLRALSSLWLSRPPRPPP